MKIKLFVSLCFAFVLSNNLSAQSMQESNNPDLSALRKLNAQFIKNFINSDTVEHYKIIHPDFVCIASSGAVINRVDYMKGWATGYQDAGYTSFGYTEEYIRIFGNMALVRSKTPYTKVVDGKTISAASIYTDTYIKENGRWRCVQAQITAVK